MFSVIRRPSMPLHRAADEMTSSLHTARLRSSSVIAAVCLVGTVACSDPAPSAGDGDAVAKGQDGGTRNAEASDPGSDAGTATDASDVDAAATDGGTDAGPTQPPTPVVGTITGFSLAVATLASDISCTASDCYWAAGSRVVQLPNGATVGTPTPAFPWTPSTFGIVSVVATSAGVFTIAEHNLPANNSQSTSELVVLRSGAWTSIGAARATVPMGASLAKAGATIYAGMSSGSGGGVDMISELAGPTGTWTKLPPNGGATTSGRYPIVDAQGRVWAVFGLQAMRILPGDPAWTAVGDAFPAVGLGRRLVAAPNGDLWFSGSSYVARLSAGSSSWTAITLPTTGRTSEVVVDGSNTAYVGLGQPHKLLKIASGATTAVDTGKVIVDSMYCGSAALDGTGALLFSCYASDVAGSGGTAGIYRSAP